MFHDHFNSVFLISVQRCTRISTEKDMKPSLRSLSELQMEKVHTFLTSIFELLEDEFFNPNQTHVDASFFEIVFRMQLVFRSLEQGIDVTFPMIIDDKEQYN